MKVYFIGAGPGDPELITLKGKKIINSADKIIYAGSLVNPEVISERKESSVVYDSAGMSLNEVISVIKESNSADIIARVHTGDPSIYGAIREQIEILKEEGIEYEVIPGVSSFTASAAALGMEFTLPGVTQTVICTRMSGRTEVPEKESLEKLASHKASMAIFLSVHMIEGVVESLLKGGYEKATPVAIVKKATWKDQKIIVGTLSDIVEKLKGEDISRMAQILVGDFLGNKFELSKLYDEKFSHGYRKGDRMKTAIFAVSRDGVTLAERIRENIESDIFTMEKYKTADSITFHKLSEEVESQFLNYRAIIFVAAAGIAVRAISGLPVSKLQDPAVIVIDETGKFVIPILSGHIGGANKIAGEIAEIIGAIPVITTATDVKGSIAVDVLAEKIKGEIESMESAKTVTALIAEGKESFIALPANVTFNQNKNTESCIIISNRKNIEIAKIIPKNIVLGIGCKAGTDSADIINFVKEILKELNLEEKSVKTVATCEKKRNEAGIIKTAEAFNAEFKVVINEDILEVEDKFEKSDFVKSQIGVYSVAEPSAYIAGSKRGRFLTGKRKFKGITAAVWEDEISIKE